MLHNIMTRSAWEIKQKDFIFSENNFHQPLFSNISENIKFLIATLMHHLIFKCAVVLGKKLNSPSTWCLKNTYKDAKYTWLHSTATVCTSKNLISCAWEDCLGYVQGVIAYAPFFLFGMTSWHYSLWFKIHKYIDTINV